MISEINSSATFMQSAQQPAKSSVVTEKAVVAEQKVQAMSAAEQQAEKEEKQKAIEEAMAEVNNAFEDNNISRRYEYDDDLDRPIMKLVDTKTKEVVTQLPTEEILNIARNIREMVGLITDNRI